MSTATTRKKHSSHDIPEKSGWVEVSMPPAYGHRSSFLRGAGNSRRLKIRYLQNTIDGGFLALVWFGPAAEGPPGHAHGGSIAAVCDEAMGLAVWLKGFRAVSGRIEIDYRQMIPLKTTAMIEVWIDKVQGRKVVAKGRMTDAEGTVFSEAKGVFISIDPQKFESPPNE